MSKHQIIGIMACDEGGVVGDGLNLPQWHAPDDLRHFRETTSGQILILGRTTYEGLPEILFKQRQAIVLTHEAPSKAKHQNITFVSNIDGMLEQLDVLQSQNKRQIFAAGGAKTIGLMLQENLLSSFLLSRIPGHHQGNVKLNPKTLTTLNSWPKTITPHANFELHHHTKPRSLA